MMPEWGIAIISVVIGTLLGFGLNLWRDTQRQKGERRQEALEIHFNQEMAGVLTTISQKNGLTVRKDKNNELKFGTGNGPFSRIEEEYWFEKDENRQALEVHFPEIAKQWEALHKRALELKEDNKNGILSLNRFDEVSFELQQLSQTASNTLEDIRKYQIGTVFKHDKNCPICKKF